MLKTVKGSCEGIINKKRVNDATSLLDADYTYFNDPLFCAYQTLIVNDDHPVSIVEKGRQIGYSHVTAFRAVLKAASNIRDTVYMSYNRESAKDFMRDVQRWCRIFNLTFSLYQEECIDDNSINIFECSFLNLRKIIAVSGDCTNLRGKPGADVIIDEACYNPNPIEDILAASMATLIHGGSVRIGSTHAGIDSDFNKLIERVKAGELPYKHIKVTFKDAIEQGLYKRICAKSRQIWTQEKQDAWVDGIYKMYGNRASEELDAEPSDYSQGGKIFKDFQFIDTSNLTPWQYIEFRYHDLAASDDDDEKNESIYYSASVKIRYVINTGKMVIVDWTAERLSPLEGDAKIEQLALLDGSKSVQLIELEPGSTGEKYVAIMQDRLVKKGIFQVFGYRPKIDKVKRAIPAGNAMCAGDLLIEAGLKDREKFTKLITKFSNKRQPLVTDLGDCISGIYDYVTNEYNWLLSSAG